MEQTLFICKEVDLFKLPPRTGASGWRSGEWRMEDKIFSGRCRVVALDNRCEVRLEDPANGEIFGLCPVPPGQRNIAVEAATDSSRNFVLRLEDPSTKRHAFIGMNFAERSNAFDFNVALTDFDKRQQRDLEVQKIASSANPLSAAQQMLPEAAALYKHQDLSLKQGESIRIEVKKKVATEGEHAGGGGGGFLSRLGGATVPLAAPGGGGFALKPPPAASPVANTAYTSTVDDVFSNFTVAPPPGVATTTTTAAGKKLDAEVVASDEGGWATFD